MKYFINYASGGFYSSQQQGLLAAKNFGFEIIGLTEVDIDEDFRVKNQKILSSKRGAGYWLWKPYLINKTIEKINYGDYLVYMDSGAMFIGDPSSYLEQIDDSGILSFSMVQKTSKWTKGDCFFEINGENKNDFKDVNQLQATYIFFKKTDFSIGFIKKWLDFCTKENLITDSPNLYMNNFEDFIDHRHDQSIFSLLGYNQKIKIVPQIDQYCIEHGLDISRQIVNRHGIRS